ncbi:hypothetical protein C6Q15_16495 [Burkholderia multivorans]|uniref:Uncharacterized protein n=1 Tax=Burkholderia multivorans TaxID=87883 RepID=A0A2S9MLM3_9BURK|nr:hypothetical protein C6Q07_30740 [Burkholderia multivorans]PRF59640.1 hypothetical protein C6Q15_16495 [Burkholderia multivorans]
MGSSVGAACRRAKFGFPLGYPGASHRISSILAMRSRAARLSQAGVGRQGKRVGVGRHRICCATMFDPTRTNGAHPCN